MRYNSHLHYELETSIIYPTLYQLSSYFMHKNLFWLHFSYSIEIFPSELQARSFNPHSLGAQEIALTDPECSYSVKHRQSLTLTSFHIITYMR